jgi:hypothetical protein
VTLTNTNVIGNQARSNLDFHGNYNSVGGNGGGIMNDTRDLGTSVVTVTAANLNDNWADQDGSGVFNGSASAQATVTVTGSAINRGNRQAVVNVGGWSLSNPDVAGQANFNLTNTAVRENLIEGERNSTEAILNIRATLQVRNCDISDNNGRGIATESGEPELPSFATVSDSVISGNGGLIGGGIVNFARDEGKSTLTVSSTTISNNHVGDGLGGSGGGIANISINFGIAFLNVDKTTISNNNAVAAGGLINGSSFGQSHATLTNSTLSGNSAATPYPTIDGGGGGIFNASGEGIATVKLINCTLSGNSTDRRGGAIANLSSPSIDPFAIAKVTLNNSTLSGNSAAQGADTIWNKASTEFFPCYPVPCVDPSPRPAIVDFANTIFNVGTLLEDFQNFAPGTITSCGYNLSSDAAGGDGSFGPGGFLNGPGDLRNTDPQLGPLQDNGGPTLTHALLFYSPAINAGDPNFNPNAFNPPLLYDQRGGPDFPRIVNGRVDIGAYELKYP